MRKNLNLARKEHLTPQIPLTKAGVISPLSAFQKFWLCALYIDHFTQEGPQFCFPFIISTLSCLVLQWFSQEAVLVLLPKPESQPKPAFNWALEGNDTLLILLTVSLPQLHK